MIEPISIILSVVLAVIAAVHFYWAAGGVWPGEDDDSLARTVVGSGRENASGKISMPPRWMTALVALAILAAAFIPLLWAGMFVSYPLHPAIVMFSMWALTIIFLARGILGMLPVFRKFSPLQPFDELNFYYYSPLCVVIGIGFLSLIFLATF